MATYCNTNYDAAAYRTYRPLYMKALYNSIMQYHRADTVQAVDVATGTGQAAVELANLFGNVRATDHSATMLSQATPAAGVTYVEEAAEQIGLPDDSVDLITVASAAHWFNMEAFQKEALRILKPQGTLAIWGYNALVSPWHPGITKALYHYDAIRMGSYCDEGRDSLRNFYADVKFLDSWSDYQRIVWDEERIAKHWHDRGVPPTSQPLEDNSELTAATVPFMQLRRMPLDALEAYLRTWSAYSNWKSSPNAKTEVDPVDEAMEVIKHTLEAAAAAAGKSANDADKSVDVVWTHALLLLRK
ncbi:S-adenosyl-L-methionine-dependent methyltransferase [Syncephalis fuscata]|nr:S-adenosyl-L-methionine-dependent methyltransferase [Syncephalis fuscata]